MALGVVVRKDLDLLDISEHDAELNEDNRFMYLTLMDRNSRLGLVWLGFTPDYFGFNPPQVFTVLSLQIKQIEAIISLLLIWMETLSFPAYWIYFYKSFVFVGNNLQLEWWDC